MTARVTALCSALLALSFAAPAIAQEAAEEDPASGVRTGGAAPAVEEDAEESPFSGIFQLDVTNAYFFRGILQEREGVILQPWMELYANLYSSESGLVHDVTVGAGIWNSFHSERTISGGNNSWWYEADYYPLLSVEFAGGINALMVYYWYDSPSDAFKIVQEFNLKLSWDDSEVNTIFPVQPWINLAVETSRTSFGPDTGVGLQAGIAPTLFELENERFPLSLSMPAEIGLALDDYYEYQRFTPAPGSVLKGEGENSFGYGAVGLLASLPITGIPENLGAWTVNAGAKYFFFNTTLEATNRGRSTYPVGTLSLAVEF